MNLVFISHGLKDPEAWRLALGIENFIHFNNPDKLKGFAEISLIIDELIYENKSPVDWILYCNNEKGIKWNEFLSMESQIDAGDDTLFLTQTRSQGKAQQEIPNLLGNFYCRPHVFTLLGSVYKIQTNMINDTRSDIESTKILFGLTRAGFNIKLI
jgi:hypothetical protein